MARILVIEDEPLLAAALAKGLREDHHVAEVARDGTSGLALAEGGDFDLLVLDLLLPGMPGLTVCRRLRAAGAPLPILVLTARDAPADIVAGLDA
ncbi:MAG: response regulator, partial [Myxococcota bacterium]